jgi:hypothetical protein
MMLMRKLLLPLLMTMMMMMMMLTLMCCWYQNVVCVLEYVPSASRIRAVSQEELLGAIQNEEFLKEVRWEATLTAAVDFAAAVEALMLHGIPW